jgi:hypothetical protein
MQRRSGWLAVLALAAIPAQGAILFTENWQADTGGLAQTALAQWNVLNGTNVDIGTFGGCATECLDTQGSGGNPSGDIETKSSFLLLGGVLHTFSFDLANANNSTFIVTIGGYSELFTPTADGNYTRTFTPIGDLSSTIRITDQGPGDNVGSYLDNIVLSTAPQAAVPEPSSWALLGLGLTAVAAMRRRIRL